MTTITLKEAETELVKLKEAFELANVRIRENGGQKSHAWLFDMKHQIYDIEDKIKDIKSNKIRTDELTAEDLKIEKRIEKLEESVNNIEQEGKQL